MYHTCAPVKIQYVIFTFKVYVFTYFESCIRKSLTYDIMLDGSLNSLLAVRWDVINV
jgi:hypothetical protein